MENARAVQTADGGTPINPASARGRLLGGLHIGLGFALTETLVYDYHNGHILNHNFLDYKLLTPVHMPKTENFLAHSYEPDGPFGAEGVSEGAMNPVPATLFNAVAQALRVRILTSPLTPEEVITSFHLKEERA